MSKMISLSLLALLLLLCLPKTEASVISHYRFEEGTANTVATGAGSILDASGFGNGTPGGDPTYRNDVPINPIPQTGAANALSLEFDGIGDEAIINVLFPFHDGGGDVTLEWWFKSPATAHQSLFGQDLGTQMPIDSISISMPTTR